MLKMACDLAVGEVIVDRMPGIIEPVSSVTANGHFVDVGCPPGWQGFRLLADSMVEIEDADVTVEGTAEVSSGATLKV